MLPEGWTCRIREIRLNMPRKDSAQKNIAMVVGLPLAYYARVEAGKCLPNAITAIRIAQALGVSVEDMYTNESH